MKPDRTRGIIAALEYLGLNPSPLPVIGRTTMLPRRLNNVRRKLAAIAALALVTIRRMKP